MLHKLLSGTVAQTVRFASYLSVCMTSFLIFLICFVKSQCEQELEQNLNAVMFNLYSPWLGPN